MRSGKESLLSTSGFSLTEVMVGGAILAGVALSGAQLFKQQTSAQKRIDYDQKIQTYHNVLSKILNRAENCNATMKLAFPSSSSTITAKPITQLYTCSSNCTDTNSTADNSYDAYTSNAYQGLALIAPGQYIDNTFTWMVDSMEIVNSLTGTGTFRLRMNYKMNPKLQAKSVSKEIALNARFSGGVFKECVNGQESSINNLQNDLCKSLTMKENSTLSDGQVAYWDDATQTCKVTGAKDCTSTPGMQLDGIGSDGVVRCKAIVNNTDALALEDSSTVTCGSSSNTQPYFDTITKKIKLRCVASTTPTPTPTPTLNTGPEWLLYSPGFATSGTSCTRSFPSSMTCAVSQLNQTLLTTICNNSTIASCTNCTRHQPTYICFDRKNLDPQPLPTNYYPSSGAEEETSCVGRYSCTHVELPTCVAGINGSTYSRTSCMSSEWSNGCPAGSNSTLKTIMWYDCTL